MKHYKVLAVCLIALSFSSIHAKYGDNPGEAAKVAALLADSDYAPLVAIDPAALIAGGDWVKIFDYPANWGKLFAKHDIPGNAWKEILPADVVAKINIVGARTGANPNVYWQMTSRAPKPAAAPAGPLPATPALAVAETATAMQKTAAAITAMGEDKDVNQEFTTKLKPALQALTTAVNTKAP